MDVAEQSPSEKKKTFQKSPKIPLKGLINFQTI